MKKIPLILSTFLLIVFINKSFAENSGEKPPKTVSISGTVVDNSSQEVIAGALIKIEGTDIEVYTDLDGKFSISDIVPDTYKIKCTMISYTDCEEEIDLDETTKNFEIKLENFSTGSTAR